MDGWSSTAESIKGWKLLHLFCCFFFLRFVCVAIIVASITVWYQFSCFSKITGTSKKRNIKVETQLDKKEVNDKVPNWLNQIELNWINPVVHCVLLNQLNSNVLSVPLQFFCLIVSMLHWFHVFFQMEVCFSFAASLKRHFWMKSSRCVFCRHSYDSCHDTILINKIHLCGFLTKLNMCNVLSGSRRLGIWYLLPWADFKSAT